MDGVPGLPWLASIGEEPRSEDLQAQPEPDVAKISVFIADKQRPEGVSLTIMDLRKKQLYLG